MYQHVTSSEFKQHTGELINQVASMGHQILITRHGEPICKVVPLDSEDKPAKVGFAAGSIEIVGDITKPIDDVWEVMDD